MGISSENSEAHVSDVALARNLVAEIAGDCWNGKEAMIDSVHDAVVDHFRRAGRIEIARRWTRRRLRSFWHREAAGVRYHEMVELAEVAQVERAARKQLEEARKSHADFIARTARLATALAIQDEEFHRETIEAFSGIARESNDQAIGNAARGRPETADAGEGAGRGLGSRASGR